MTLQSAAFTDTLGPPDRYFLSDLLRAVLPKCERTWDISPASDGTSIEHATDQPNHPSPYSAASSPTLHRRPRARASMAPSSRVNAPTKNWTPSAPSVLSPRPYSSVATPTASASTHPTPRPPPGYRPPNLRLTVGLSRMRPTFWCQCNYRPSVHL